MEEIIVTGYCRVIDGSRTVMVEEGEADCCYPDCAHAADRPIARQINATCETQDAN